MMSLISARLHIALSVPCHPPNYEAINHQQESRLTSPKESASVQKLLAVAAVQKTKAAGCDLNLTPGRRQAPCCIPRTFLA